MNRTTILKTFRSRVIIHVALLLLVFIIAFLITQNSPSYFAYLILGALAIHIIISLFRLVNRTNRDVANFLLSIRYNDFETTYTQSQTQTTEKKSLYQAFNLITDKFRDLRSEQEIQHQFLSAIVENVDTGLLCFDETGRTLLMNKALRGILHKSYFPTLNSIQKFSVELYKALNTMGPGQNQLVKVESDFSVLQLAIICTVLIIDKKELRLFVIQNINEQLEQQELQSWQKLIRILTHEIMNSVSPVVSLAATTDDIIEQAEGLDPETRNNIHMAIKAIQNRSSSLLSFTQKYRQLTRIPNPEMSELNINDLIRELSLLHEPDFKEKGVGLEIQLPNRDLMIDGDPSLLEQAFINLFKNSLEALENIDKGKLEVRVFKDAEETVVQFVDNGPGIESSMLEKIFIPFFTTKKKGSGIGLSLCRQIILMHKGSIHVQSVIDRGTIFTVRL